MCGPAGELPSVAAAAARVVRRALRRRARLAHRVVVAQVAVESKVCKQLIIF